MEDNKELKLGLGDAILRLVKVQFQSHLGFGDTRKQNQVETKMIVEALNQYELDLGFDCNLDGLPDTVADIVGAKNVDIFNVSAKTSCCRIMKEPKKSSSRKTQTSSRRKASRKKR